MKNFLFVVLFAVTANLTAQIQFQSAALGETTSAIDAISIGNVGNNTDIKSRLHVNNFYCNSPGSPTFNGFLFRTDGDQDISNRWQLCTGPSATSQSERFRLYCDSLTAPFIGFRSLSNGMRFETGGSNIRMRINGNSSTTINGFTVNNSGFVAW